MKVSFADLLWVYLKTVFFTSIIIGLLLSIWAGSVGYQQGFPLNGHDIPAGDIQAFYTGCLYGLPFGLFYGVLLGGGMVGPLWLACGKIRKSTSKKKE